MRREYGIVYLEPNDLKPKATVKKEFHLHLSDFSLTEYDKAMIREVNTVYYDNGDMTRVMPCLKARGCIKPKKFKTYKPRKLKFK